MKEGASRKNQEGIKLLEQGKLEEALRLFNEAIEIDGEYSAAWLNRSDVYRKLGKEADADANIESWKVIQNNQQKLKDEEISRRDKETLETTLLRLGQIIEEKDSKHLLIRLNHGKILLDGDTEDITLEGRRFSIIHGKRIIPFSEVMSVAWYYKRHHPEEGMRPFSLRQREDWELILNTVSGMFLVDYFV